mmetsp:Transcript_95720/g.184623  ORF Transcript_95720/g.184623 Transcript_95720/m.184623 type:complete len:231 (-) Transcript_95720:84-776(-)
MPNWRPWCWCRRWCWCSWGRLWLCRRDCNRLPCDACPSGIRDFHVTDDALACIRTVTLFFATGRLIHPGHGFCRVAPVGDAEAHAVSHCGTQSCQVTCLASSMVKCHPICALLQCCNHSDKRVGLCGECSDHLEWLGGVDSELGTRTIRVGHVARVLPTAATIAVSVVPICGRVTLVRRRLKCMVVSLHYVHFWAPLATNLVSIAIVVTRGQHVVPRNRCSICVASGCRN